jgi:hypothetical protein
MFSARKNGFRKIEITQLIQTLRGDAQVLLEALEKTVA